MTDFGSPVRPPVERPDRSWARLSRLRQLASARPRDSLGDLDEVIHRVAAIRGDATVRPLPTVVSVLAADHGVAANGTSAFRPGVTAAVLQLLLDGQAPANILARQVSAAVKAADFGLVEPVGDGRYRAGAGTGDISRQDAMTTGQACHAIDHGVTFATDQLGSSPMVAVGEIGVGNTTVAAALAARLLHLGPDAVAGPGAIHDRGRDAETIDRKRRLIDRDAIRQPLIRRRLHLSSTRHETNYNS